MKHLTKEQSIYISNDFVILYQNNLPFNFVTEVRVWYEIWTKDIKPLDSIEYLDLIGLSKDFYPDVADAI